jgi:hypothetical protein
MQLVELDAALAPTAPAVAPLSPPRWNPADSTESQDGLLVDLPRFRAPLPAPASSPLDRTLCRQARLLRQRLSDLPDLAAQQAAEKLAKDVVFFTTATMDAINAELRDLLSIGVVVSSARPGLKRIALVLSDRLDGKRRRLECSLTTSPNAHELVLLAESLGRVAEVVRVAVRSNKAAAMLREGVEHFVLETAERFANGIGASRIA